jgi:hypothetical protein
VVRSSAASDVYKRQDQGNNHETNQQVVMPGLTFGFAINR